MLATTASRHPRRRVGAALILRAAGAIAMCAPSLAAEDSPAPPPRTPWQNERLLGTPEPPPPYTVEKTFPRLEWKAPIHVIPEPGTDRLWVALQGGEKDRPSRIVSVECNPEAETTAPVLAVESRLVYGLAFHPAYADNRFVFVFTNGPTPQPERKNRVSRYTASRQGPSVCDPATEVPVIEWRSAGHDGGDLAFGLDGMLYITAGDGTSDSDTWDSAQDVSNLLGSLLRIDVDRPAPGMQYSIPPDNPFVSLPGARGEIWAFGFRNPWRLDIDSRTSDVWVGNNGQDLWETVHLVKRGDNAGWSVHEGSHPFYPHRRRGPAPIVPPTIEHPHSEFRSLTGGVVYHGDKLPELEGAYVYGDYSTGKIWGARHENGRLTWHRELADTALQISAFRVDQRGELLVVDHGGGIYRLVPRPPVAGAAGFPALLSHTGLFTSVKDLRPGPGLLSYSVNVPGWADGADAERFFGLPGDARIGYSSSRGWSFPNDAVIAQTLSLQVAPSIRRRLETRLLIKQDGEWFGVTYRWNEDGSDAALVVKEGETFEVEIADASGASRRQTWRVPSRADCLTCHSRAANFLLGLTESQMNREHEIDGRRENQLTALERLGCFSGAPASKPESRGRLADPYDDREDLDRRARAYLHANCSVCHVEAGGGNAAMELEAERARDRMNLFDARPQHDTFGIKDAMLVAPGDPSRSVLLHRVSRRGPGQMPPLVTSRVDERAVALLSRWIAAMPPQNPWVRDWTLEEVLAALPELRSGRDLDAGKSAYRRVGCAQCHRLGDGGGTVGPDLNGIARRLSAEELAEAILEPSRKIADELAACEIQTTRGEVLTGRLEREDEREIVLRTGSFLEGLVRVAKADVLARSKSAVSNMPAGILNVLQRGQILDLLAYILAAGKAGGERFEMTRMVAHWAGYDQPEYLDFIARAGPDLAQVGFYGAHFWSLVHTPHHGGYPAHFPVRGIKEASEWFAGLNRKLHERGVKVVGHFNVEFLVGDPDSPEGPRGFFRFYRDLWDEAMLGPRPVADPVALLEKKSDGTPLTDNNYGIGGMKEYWACLRNPAWQQVLKAWIRRGIELGVDGFVANYFYRHDCTCEHCDRAFRDYLRRRFPASELQERFGIAALDSHRFPEIVSWHDPAQSTPLRREMLRFSQLSNKEVFDEVFVRHGRAIKPDLLVAQWNHLGDFAQVSGDERCFLPAEAWGKDEDYLWYSLGGSANYTDLANGFLGEGTLQARYIRGAFNDKPYTLGKYEGTRIRVSIAELAANGGAPMGFYTDFSRPESRDIIVAYYQFLRRHDPLFRANRPAAEAALLFPRRAIHAGDLGPLSRFRSAGRALLDAHVLFDVVPDDLAAPERMAAYAAVLDPAVAEPAPWLDRFDRRSRFQAPAVVRVSCSRPAGDDNEWDVHLVNYGRTEPPPQADGKPSPGAGAQDEKPAAVERVVVSLRLPGGRTVKSVEVITPERPDGTAAPFEATEDGVRFAVEGFLVYAVARVRAE